MLGPGAVLPLAVKIRCTILAVWSESTTNRTSTPELLMTRRSTAKQEIEAKLKSLGADYEAKVGRAFDHFYCPVLFRDELTELCRAHVINRVFANTSRAWTVQRKDVDNFFGTNFEADFVVLGEAQSSDAYDRVFDDPQLHAKLCPRILLDGEEVGHYGLGKAAAPEKFTAVGIDRPGSFTPIALKMNPEAVASALERNWQIEIDCDLRVSAFVSLLKAAHLSLFEVLGYKYALSVAGHFLGQTILGDFFSANHHKPKADVILAAKAYFAEFAHMLRPVMEPDANIQGTVTDRRILVCHASSGGFWSQIVFIRTGALLHSVMLPIWDNPEKVPVFLGFLKDDRENINASWAQHHGDQGWQIASEKIPMIWTKKGAFTFS
jgi:hypothetical protein